MLRTTSPPPTSSPHDGEGAGSIVQAMAQWLMGDWLALAKLNRDRVAAHPDRDRLALLVACAHQQIDQHDLARDWLRQAFAWGCHTGLAARLLLSGVHNTLGRVAALREDQPALTTHFGEAMRVTGDPHAAAATQARAVREMAQLGLIPQAASLVATQLDAARTGLLRPARLEHRLESLAADVEALKHSARMNSESAPPGSSWSEGHLDWDQLARLASHPDGDDLWLARRTKGQLDGRFLEFVSEGSCTVSPTYLAERRLGWTGLLLTRSPRVLHALRSHRRSQSFQLSEPAMAGAELADGLELFRRLGAVSPVDLLVLDEFAAGALGGDAVDFLNDWRPARVLVPRGLAGFVHGMLANAGYRSDVDAPWRFELITDPAHVI